MDMSTVGILMDQISEPSIIIDLGHKLIVQVNAELITITGFSRDELYLASPFDLIGNIENIDLGQTELQIELSRKNKTAAQIQAKAIVLDPEKKIILLELLGFNKNTKNERFNLSSLIKIFAFSDAHTKDEYLKQVVKELTRINPNVSINLFLYNPEKRIYCKFNKKESDTIFPDSYSDGDIKTIYPIEVWRPGKRVMNGFQRVARTNGLSALLVCPMVNQEKIPGFVIISEENEAVSTLDVDLWTTITNIINQIIIFLDIHEGLVRQKAEKEKQGKIFDEIFANVPAGILFVSNNHVQKINTYAEVALGYAKWEIENISINELFSGSEILIKNLNANKEKTAQATTTLHRRDGEKIKVLIQTIPIDHFETSNQKQEFLILFNDLSEIEKIELKTKQLEQQALVGMMMAYFAHDVRNIVNSIQIWANTSELKIKNGNINGLSTDGIKEDCDRMILLMESILSYSRSLETKMEPIEIVDFLQRLLDRMQPKLSRFNIRTIYKVEDDIPLLFGDKRSLEQVFSNLVNNAKNAMEEGGGTLAININCEGLKNEKIVVIKIADTGSGIPDDVINKLFEPYMTTRSGGTGLGLVISQKIIMAHKGKIHVTSFPGGTTFTISIPAYITE